MNENTTLDVQVTEGKVARNYQQLPTLHFITMDDWLDKLGEKSFCFWLKLFTKVDRTDADVNNHCIRTRKSKLVKSLGISDATFYRYIKPLYEYGLIDLVEFEGSKNDGSKPVNIIVYRFPQNRYELNVQPLEKCRDWKQRTEEKYSFTYKGGRNSHKYLTDYPVDAVEAPVEEVSPIVEEAPVEEVKSPLMNATGFKEGIDETTIAKFNAHIDLMTYNKVDIEEVKTWINATYNEANAPMIQFVMRQLATYKEAIRNTRTFIINTVSNYDSLKPVVTVAAPVVEAAPAVEYTPPRVPFYNWLEERE